MIELKPLTKEHVTPFYNWFKDDAIFKEKGDLINTFFRDGQFNDKIVISIL